MKTMRRHLPSLAWFALVAMLALAMLPTVSRAMASAQGDGGGWVEVCTAQGMVRMALEGTADDLPHGPASPGSASGHLDHCPYCSLSAHAVGLPPAPPPALGLSAGAGHLPPLFLLAPRTLFAWSSAQPRAPPLNT
ncbi:MAG: DUF2946 domain-containing protein [Rubrivivax sp.]|nr:DUF2946 domain-containing protein [Rubrivivax sp.]